MFGLSDTRAAHVEGKLESYTKHREEYSIGDQAHIDAAVAWHLTQATLYLSREFAKYGMAASLVDHLVEQEHDIAIAETNSAIALNPDSKFTPRLRRAIGKKVSIDKAISQAGRIRGLHFDALYETDQARWDAELQQSADECRARIAAGQHDGFGTSYPEIDYTGINENDPPSLVKSYKDAPEQFDRAQRKIQEWRDRQPDASCLMPPFKTTEARDAYMNAKRDPIHEAALKEHTERVIGKWATGVNYIPPLEESNLQERINAKLPE